MMYKVVNPKKNIEITIVDRRKIKKLKRKYFIKYIDRYTHVYRYLMFSNVKNKRFCSIIINEVYNNCKFVISCKKLKYYAGIKHCDIKFHSTEFVKSITNLNEKIDRNNKLYIIFHSENDYLKWKLKNEK